MASTQYTLPANWDNSGDALKVTHGHEYIKWSWKEMEWVTVGETSTQQEVIKKSLFDFRVFPFVVGGISAEVEEDNTWGVSFGYRVINVSGKDRGFDANPRPSQQRLIREILSLSYATVNPLPKRGDPVFPAERTDEYKLQILPGPIIDSINVQQEGDQADVWTITYKVKKIKSSGGSAVEPTESVPEMHEPYPWEKKPKITVSFGVEDFVIGCGFYMGITTPANLSTYVQGEGSIAEKFVPTSGKEYDIVKNTVGDPIKSPPPIKLPTANFTFEIAAEEGEDLTNFINGAEAAATKVNLLGFQVPSITDAYNIKAGTAMLTGFSIAQAEFMDKRDWLPRQKHPFERTYKQLGWKTSTVNENKIAVNYFTKILSVTQAVSYKVMNIVFSSKASGWGMIIPNRGYRSLDNGPIPEKITNDNSETAEERLLDHEGKKIIEGADTKEKQCLLVYTPFSADNSLKTLIASLPWDREFPVLKVAPIVPK